MRSRKREVVRALFPKERFAVLLRDGFACRYCGATPPKVRLEVDHIKSRKSGGGNTMDNCITACVRCNAGKGDKTLPKRFAPPLKRSEFAKQFDTISPTKMALITIAPKTRHNLKVLGARYGLSMGAIIELLLKDRLER